MGSLPLQGVSGTGGGEAVAAAPGGGRQLASRVQS